MSTPYITYLPAFLAQLQEFQALGDAQDGAVEDLETTLRGVGAYFYVETLPVDGLSRWEGLLGLANGTGLDIDDRRFRLLTYMIPQTPFTITRLHELLSELCGAEGYSIAWDDDFTLVVRVALASKLAYSSVTALLQRVTPANLVLDISLLYNNHQFVGTATHQMLADFTHQAIKEEERETWQL